MTALFGITSNTLEFEGSLAADGWWTGIPRSKDMARNDNCSFAATSIPSLVSARATEEDR